MSARPHVPLTSRQEASMLFLDAHPVRFGILLFLRGHGASPTTAIQAAMPTVARSTLFKHLAEQERAGYIAADVPEAERTKFAPLRWQLQQPEIDAALVRLAQDLGSTGVAERLER